MVAQGSAWCAFYEHQFIFVCLIWKDWNVLFLCFAGCWLSVYSLFVTYNEIVSVWGYISWDVIKKELHKEE
jgi:hypothetical protein